MELDRGAIAGEGLLVVVTHRLGDLGPVRSSEVTRRWYSKTVGDHDLN